jgi:two-component system, OmpR family, sensor kinase
VNRLRNPWKTAGLRTRLLGSVIVGTVIALGGLVIAFNFVLRSRLDSDANDLARARAAAQVSALQLTRGRIVLPEASDARNPDLEVWVFQNGIALERPRSSQDNDRAATRLAGIAPSFADVASTETRLYAAPVGEGRRIGAVVVGVNLGAYEETRHTALIASAILAAAVLLLVIVAARWLIERALQPVAAMTRQASEWSEHDLDGRFTPGGAKDEIALLAETLNGLLERLGASLRHEQRLSAEISHELRTPLANVIAEAQLAQRHGVQDETLERILAGAQELSQTLDTLMSAARAEYSPHGARSDAVVCAQTALDAARGVRPVDDLSLQLDAPGGPATVGVEAPLVERILAPLVENAIRHADSLVVIRVRREDDAVRLSVEDDGPGVPAHEREAIFAPGQGGAAHGAGRVVGAGMVVSSSGAGPGGGTLVTASGAGLGLALCRRLATSAGGEVRLEPGGRGARFTVRLPAA